MRYTFSQSDFACISARHDEFGKYDPTIELLFPKAASLNPVNARSAMNMFSQLNASLYKYGPCQPYQYGIQFTGSVLREIIDILFQYKKITDSDYANIQTKLKDFEKSIERTALVTTKLLPRQKKILQKIISPYIEGILDQVPDLPLAIKICGVGMCDIPLSNDISQKDKNFNVTYRMGHRTRKEFKKTIKKSEARQQIYNCTWKIWLVYSQVFRLDDVLLSVGNNLPSIDTQRKAIATFLFNSVNNRLKSTGGNFYKIRQAAKLLLKKHCLDKNILYIIQKPQTSKPKKKQPTLIQKTQKDQYTYHAKPHIFSQGLFKQRRVYQIPEGVHPQRYPYSKLV